MHPCNRGEMLTRSVQEKAAKTTAELTTSARFREPPKLFIALGSCDNCVSWASNFLGSARASRALPIGDGPFFRTNYSELLPVFPTCVWKTISRLPGPKVFGAVRARTFSAHLVFS